MTLDRAILDEEVDRLVARTEAAGLTVRLLGSLAVARHCPDAAPLLADFARRYADIDLAAYGRDARAVTAALTASGYRDDREVFVSSEGRRSIFERASDGIRVDVFYDRLDFCHVIPIVGRLEADRPTVPLAELLLSKLQIVRINEKDVVDVVVLLLGHPLGASDDDTIDIGRIARLCAADWGLWRTVSGNLDKVVTLAAGYPQLDAARRTRVDTAALELKSRMDAEPKPLPWRIRARVGDRRQWWTEVEEVR